MLFSAKTSRNQDQRGAAAVEFALVAPLLILLVMGIISYGYMLSFRQALSQGAAEGARATVISPLAAEDDWRAEGLKAVNEALNSYGVSCNGVAAGSALRRNAANVGTCSVLIDACAQDATKLCVTVAIDYAYRDHPLLPSAPGVGLVLPPNLSYSANARLT